MEGYVYNVKLSHDNKAVTLDLCLMVDKSTKAHRIYSLTLMGINDAKRLIITQGWDKTSKCAKNFTTESN